MNAENNVLNTLNSLSKEINKLYGYVNIAGDNFGEPAINSGPCGPFANAFYKIWNQKFTEKVNIAFIMVKNSDECWHILIRLPNGLLFDGGFGVHNEDKWNKDTFDVEDKSIISSKVSGLCSKDLRKQMQTSNTTWANISHLCFFWLYSPRLFN